MDNIIWSLLRSHYHVPPAVARKGTYEQQGLKLHVYNGHIFVAQHFSKPLVYKFCIFIIL